MFSASDDAAGVVGTRIDALHLMNHLPRHLLACLLTRQPDMHAVDDALERAEQGGAAAGGDYKRGTPLGALSLFLRRGLVGVHRSIRGYITCCMLSHMSYTCPGKIMLPCVYYCRMTRRSMCAPSELSAFMSDMEYTDTYRDHITQGLQLLSHLLTVAPSVAGFGEALQLV